MKKIFAFSFLLFLLASCQKSFSLVSIEDSQQKFTTVYTEVDSSIEREIEPYRKELEKSMSGVLAVANKDLPKAKPESLLGNLLADATLAMAAKYTQSSIDVGIMNYGGIRVPSISKGPVTLGNVYEVMPFDNFLVVLELDGKTLQAVFDKIASVGGWPISGASFIIKDGNAHFVKVNNERIIETKIYRVAISDYLANGGDNLSLLKGIPQENTNVLLRDAFIAYFTLLNDQGKNLDAQIENRITNE